MKMGESEGLATYHRRFQANFASIVECATRAGKADTIPDDEMQATHFVYTLSSSYRQYKECVMREIVEKPKTLQKAYESTYNFGPNARERPFEGERRVAFKVSPRKDTTGRGRGGRGGRGRGGRGNCAICDSPDHWKNECPKRGKLDNNEDANIEKAIKEVRFKPEAGATKGSN
jgi:hypothetical protein